MKWEKGHICVRKYWVGWDEPSEEINYYIGTQNLQVGQWIVFSLFKKLPQTAAKDTSCTITFKILLIQSNCVKCCLSKLTLETRLYFPTHIIIVSKQGLFYVFIFLLEDLGKQMQQKISKNSIRSLFASLSNWTTSTKSKWFHIYLIMNSLCTFNKSLHDHINISTYALIQWTNYALP